MDACGRVAKGFGYADAGSLYQAQVRQHDRSGRWRKRVGFGVNG